MRGRYYVAGAIASFAVAIGLMLGPQGRDALAQTAFRLFNGTSFENHMLVTGSAPTMTGGVLRPGSTDFAGQYTHTANGTNAVLTFATAYTVPPFCLAADETTPEGVSVITAGSPAGTPPATATATFRGPASGDFVAYICFGTINN